MAKNEKPSDSKLVKGLAALGLDVTLIAKRVGLSVEELQQKFARELETALPEMRARNGGRLFAKARAGNIAAICFWLKTRAGWSEKIFREVEPEPKPAEPEKPAPRDPNAPYYIRIPCNTRNPCPRDDLKLDFQALLLIRDELLEARKICLARIEAAKLRAAALPE